MKKLLAIILGVAVPMLTFASMQFLASSNQTSRFSTDMDYKTLAILIVLSAIFILVAVVWKGDDWFEH